MMIPKPERIRDEKWRRYLHEQPCRRCGTTTGCQAAHLGHGRPKPGDDQCVSLCPPCHAAMDTCPTGKEKFWVEEVVIPEERRAYQDWKRMQ